MINWHRAEEVLNSYYGCVAYENSYLFRWGSGRELPDCRFIVYDDDIVFLSKNDPVEARYDMPVAFGDLIDLLFKHDFITKADDGYKELTEEETKKRMIDDYIRRTRGIKKL